MLELLVAVVLLGVVGIAVLASLGAAATGAATQSSIAEAQSWLATTADAISARDGEYLDCDAHSQSQIISAYQAEVDSHRASDAPAVTVSNVGYWDGSDFTNVCDYGSGNRLQEVVLTVATLHDQLSLTAVKRDEAVPSVGVGPLPPEAPNPDGSIDVDITPGLDGP